MFSSSPALAEDRAAVGNHYDALPRFERELGRTQAQACWAPYREAARRLGSEILRLGRFADAAWYSVVSHEFKLSAAVGDALLNRRDVQFVRESVLRLLSAANLLRHFAVACKFLAVIGDAIPDDLVDTVARWILPRCSLLAAGWGTSGPLNMAWKALEPIGERLSAGVASEVMHAAINHDFWNQLPKDGAVYVEREQMVETMTHCLHALRHEDLSMLARKAVPLATNLRQNHDFAEVVNLLCHVADRVGGEIKSWIGDQLFPMGQPVTYLVGQVAATFGKEFLPPDRMAKAVEQVAHNLRLQVQRLGPSEEPVVVPGSIMTYNVPLGEEKMVVSLVQGVELHAMTRHRRDSQPDALRHLIEAAVAAITDRDNLLTNRESVIRSLMDFGDSVLQELAEVLLNTLEPPARGEIEVSTRIKSSTDDPVSAFKVELGKPSQIRRIAVLALARIGKHWTDKYGPKLQPILEQALTDLDPDVRQYAFAAARELPRLNEATFMAVLLGTRDADPAAAAAAFAALATKEGLSLQRGEWLLLLYAAKMALQSASPLLRRTATAALARLHKQSPSGEIRSGMDAVMQVSATDICASVRRAVTERTPSV